MMRPGDKAGSWPFRYSSHAVSTPMPDKSSVWYRMFHHRYRTIVGYWATATGAKDHLNLFRNTQVTKRYQTPKSEHAVTRSELVLFYEGALDYALAHLDDVVEALETSLRDQRSAVITADRLAEESRSLSTAIEERDEEIDALRWSIKQIAKANRTEPAQTEQW